MVDPQRDVEQYLQEAAAHGFQITYIIETHLHADFVSGHRELAARTGADIVFGHRAGATFPHRAVHDGDALRLGNVTLRVLETPGHTPESISVVVIDHAVSEEPHKVLTGDTLFIGDVGRPDLAGSKGHTAEQMAGMLYESLHSKLLMLEDRVEVIRRTAPARCVGGTFPKKRPQPLVSRKSLAMRSSQSPRPISCA